MLASVAEVRPGERRGAAAAFLTLFGILASHTLLETARDALFLARLPLLGLRHRGEDFEKIYRGLRSASPKVRASSRELLANLLDPSLREAVVGIVDDVPDTERLAHALSTARLNTQRCRS